MQPKNKTNRTAAFINFLLLFIVSLVIIITTVFFSIQVPLKQTNDLLKKMYVVQKERKFSADFLTGMSQVTGMLDSINTKATKPELLDVQITEAIQNLQIKVDADSVYEQMLYKEVVKNMYDLKEAKKQLRQVTTTDASAKDLKKQVDDLNDHLRQSTKDYNDLQDRTSKDYNALNDRYNDYVRTHSRPN